MINSHKSTFLLLLTVFVLSTSGCRDFYLLTPQSNNSACDRQWAATLNANQMDNLSSLSTCNCSSVAGGFPLLSGITVHKERTANLDNFIAAMFGHCQLFSASQNPGSSFRLHPDHSPNSFEIFDANHRPDSETLEVPEGNFIFGIDIKINNTDGYLKNIRLRHAPVTIANANGGEIRLGSQIQNTNWATGYDGPIISLDCLNPGSTLRAVSCIRVQYDQRNGKVKLIALDFSEFGLRRYGSNSQAMLQIRKTGTLVYDLQQLQGDSSCRENGVLAPTFQSF